MRIGKYLKDLRGLKQLDDRGSVFEFWYGKIPYRVSCHLDLDNDGFADSPAVSFVSEDLHLVRVRAPSKSFSIFVFDSTPEKFLEIVIFHEFKEWEAILTRGLDKDSACREAAVKTKKFAREVLTTEGFEKFIAWTETLVKDLKAENAETENRAS